MDRQEQFVVQEDIGTVPARQRRWEDVWYAWSKEDADEKFEKHVSSAIKPPGAVYRIVQRFTAQKVIRKEGD